MKKNRFILLLLAFLFIAPGVTACLFYLNPQWLSGQTTNKGHFVHDTQPLHLSKEEKWHLILWSPTTCDPSCTQRLEALTRVQLALGRQYYSVDLCLLEPENTDSFNTKILSQLSTKASIFIANPHQKIILAYDLQAPLEDIFQDLKHLLTTDRKSSL